MKKTITLLMTVLMLAAAVFTASGCIRIIYDNDASKAESGEPTEPASIPQDTETGTEPASSETESAPSETETEPAFPFAAVAGVFEYHGTTGEIRDRYLAFSDNGRYYYEVTFSDGVSGFSIGNFTVSQDTIAMRQWFTGGGDPSLEPAPDTVTRCRIDSDTKITELNETYGELSFTRSQDMTLISAYDADRKVTDAITKLALMSDGAGWFDPPAAASPGTLFRYRAADQDKDPIEMSVYLQDDGRFIWEYQYKDGTGHLYGNCVKIEDAYHCEVWFSQSGDPMVEAMADTQRILTIRDDGTLSTEFGSDPPIETYLLTEVTEKAEAEAFAKQFDIGSTLKHGRLWNETPYHTYPYQ